MIIDNVRRNMEIYIAQNPYDIIVLIRAKVDNGYDKQVPDLTASSVSSTLGTARISRRRLPEPILTSAKTPYDYQDVYYMLAAYDATWLKKGLIFEYYGSNYRTGKVEDRIVFGAIAYRLCNIEEVTGADIGDMYG